MILESADKMHKIATKCIEPCDINDELVQNIKKLAKQGIYSYTFQGDLDFLTAKKIAKDAIYNRQDTNIRQSFYKD